MELNGALLAAILLRGFFPCRPFDYNRDKTVPKGVYDNATKSHLTIGVVNMIIGCPAYNAYTLGPLNPTSNKGGH